jgi:peptidoglycan/LPS O-acetylase OafA/YrhL
MASVPANSSSTVCSLAHWFSELWIRGGWIGVDLFFVLSGFLVSGLLFREHQKFGGISAKDFLIRRGFKIYPAFWMLIGVTALLHGLFRHQFNTKATLSELLFLQNYSRGLWPHTWSLAVEEHFYILLLILLLFLSKRSHSFSSVPTVFVVLAVTSLCLRIYESYSIPYSDMTHLFRLICGWILFFAVSSFHTYIITIRLDSSTLLNGIELRHWHWA